MKENRFTDALTDQERALLVHGITLLFMDAIFGVVTPGQAWETEHLAREFPVLTSLMNELGQKWDIELDPELMERVKQKLSEDVMDERTTSNGGETSGHSI